ncbi:MAG: amidase family protein [Pseudomonadota bacterium]
MSLRHALSVVSLVLLCACNRSTAPALSAPARDDTTPALFELVEADMARVHNALAGKALLADGSTLTCVKLVQMYQERIFAYNDAPQAAGPPVRGVLMLNPHALEQAAALDELYAQDHGVGTRYLHCMPVLLKDNYDTYDHPSTQGSYSMLGHQAGADAHSVEGLRSAGALILGKANQDEFAFFTSGFSDRAIQVGNAYNTAQSPAGSSSGTGASLAANFALGGTGSDTCQSIRHPSSVEGLVGIRPSLGVISQHGIFPLSHARDTGGPMTRSVRDSALMLTAMSGVDERDPKTLEFAQAARPVSYEQFLDRGKYGVAGRKLGLLRSFGEAATDADGDGAQATLIEAAATKLREMGAEVVDVTLPGFINRSAGSRHYDMNDYFQQFEAGGGHSARRCVSSLLKGSSHGREACLGLDGILENTIRIGTRGFALFATTATADPDMNASSEELQAIVETRDYVTGVMDDLKLDALILSPGPTGGRTCDLGSTTQMGSIVVPVGFDDSVGVPRGMEIFVRRFDEGTGLGIAYDYEQATHHRAPPVLVPSPLTANATLADFNARQQQLLMSVTAVAPEDVPLAAYQQALEAVVGPRNN